MIAQHKTYQHYDNVSICMVPELSEPSLHILVGQVLGDVVDQQGTNCSPVVPAQKEGFNTIHYNFKVWPWMCKMWNNNKKDWELWTYAEVMAL